MTPDKIALRGRAEVVLRCVKTTCRKPVVTMAGETLSFKVARGTNPTFVILEGQQVYKGRCPECQTVYWVRDPAAFLKRREAAPSTAESKGQKRVHI